MSNFDDDDDLDLDSDEDEDRFDDRGDSDIELDDDDDDASGDEDDFGERTGPAVSGRGSPKAELERILEQMDEDDPRRRSIEREFERVMEESVGRFGIGVFG